MSYLACHVFEFGRIRERNNKSFMSVAGTPCTGPARKHDSSVVLLGRRVGPHSED